MCVCCVCGSRTARPRPRDGDEQLRGAVDGEPDDVPVAPADPLHERPAELLDAVAARLVAVATVGWTLGWGGVHEWGV